MTDATDVTGVNVHITGLVLGADGICQGFGCRSRVLRICAVVCAGLCWSRAVRAVCAGLCGPCGSVFAVQTCAGLCGSVRSVRSILRLQMIKGTL